VQLADWPLVVVTILATIRVVQSGSHRSAPCVSDRAVRKWSKSNPRATPSSVRTEQRHRLLQPAAEGMFRYTAADAMGKSIRMNSQTSEPGGRGGPQASV